MLSSEQKQLFNSTSKVLNGVFVGSVTQALGAKPVSVNTESTHYVSFEWFEKLKEFFTGSKAANVPEQIKSYYQILQNLEQTISDEISELERMLAAYRDMYEAALGTISAHPEKYKAVEPMLKKLTKELQVLADKYEQLKETEQAIHQTLERYKDIVEGKQQLTPEVIKQLSETIEKEIQRNGKYLIQALEEIKRAKGVVDKIFERLQEGVDFVIVLKAGGDQATFHEIRTISDDLLMRLFDDVDTFVQYLSDFTRAVIQQGDIVVGYEIVLPGHVTESQLLNLSKLFKKAMERLKQKVVEAQETLPENARIYLRFVTDDGEKLGVYEIKLSDLKIDDMDLAIRKVTDLFVPMEVIAKQVTKKAPPIILEKIETINSELKKSVADVVSNETEFNAIVLAAMLVGLATILIVVATRQGGNVSKPKLESVLDVWIALESVTHPNNKPGLLILAVIGVAVLGLSTILVVLILTSAALLAPDKFDVIMNKIGAGALEDAIQDLVDALESSQVFSWLGPYGKFIVLGLTILSSVGIALLIKRLRKVLAGKKAWFVIGQKLGSMVVSK